MPDSTKITLANGLPQCPATSAGRQCGLPEGHITPHATWNVTDQAYEEWDR